MMIDIKATYEIPETETRHWTEIYNSLLQALFIPEVDGPRVMSSSGGPIGNVGVLSRSAEPDMRSRMG